MFEIFTHNIITLNQYKIVFVMQEIERLKNEKPTWERKLRWEGMKNVFGGQPSFLWINPFSGIRIRRLLPRPMKGGPEFAV